MKKSLAIRIDTKLKEDFDKVCKENSVNYSALIRNFMQKYVDENTAKEDTPLQ